MNTSTKVTKASPINSETRKHAIMDYFIEEGIGQHYKIHKSKEDTVLFVAEVTKTVNRKIPNHPNMESFLYYLECLKDYIYEKYDSDFAPSVPRIIKLVTQYNERVNYKNSGGSADWESWELPRNTRLNPPNEAFIYNDEFKQRASGFFPEEQYCFVKSYIDRVHKGKRVFGEARYIKALIDMGLSVKHTLSENEIG